MRRRVRVGLAGIVLLACTGACSEDGAGAPGACGAATCPDVCARVVPGLCDVRERACLQRLLDAVSCVRGTPGELPELRTLTEDEYRAEAEASRRIDAGVDAATADEDAGVGAAPGDGGVPSEEDPMDSALVLLGLIEPMRTFDEAVEESLSLTAGYYESTRERITLIDRGEALDDLGAVGTLVHELVHALQDQTVGLIELPRPGPGQVDAQLANGCLIEGDAELYGAFAMSLLVELPRTRVDWELSFERRLKGTQRTLLRAESPYRRLWLLRYPLGVRYLWQAHEHGGNWGVQRLFEAPPTSMIQWMVGYDVNTTRMQHLVAPFTCDFAHEPEGYEPWGRFTLGASALYAFLGRHLRSAGHVELEEQWRNAQHWRQDALLVLVGPVSEVALSYRIRLDEPALAAQLADRLRDALPEHLRVRHGAEELEILGAEDATVLGSWPGDGGECAAPE